MMRIKNQKDYLVALESVAMTDIVLTMFIFFFISFSLIYTFSPTRISKVDVKLPKARSALALEGLARAVVSITGSGEFFIDDDPVDQKKLKDILALRIKEDPSLGLLLKVDSNTRFDNVAIVLDIINELGIDKVSVAAERTEQEG